MKKVRTFIAIPLPEEVQHHLGTMSAAWSEQIPEGAVRWVKPHLMHATLRFLGNTDQALISRLSATLDEVASKHRAFTISLDRPGCFPNSRRPRVVWVGLQGEMEAAQGLKQAVDQALVPLGWELEDRSFRPHLTVGRVKDSRKVRGCPWEAEIKPLPILVDSIHLIESDLQRSGPVYTVRHKSVLHTPEDAG